MWTTEKKTGKHSVLSLHKPQENHIYITHTHTSTKTHSPQWTGRTDHFAVTCVHRGHPLICFTSIKRSGSCIIEHIKGEKSKCAPASEAVFHPISGANVSIIMFGLAVHVYRWLGFFYYENLGLEPCSTLEPRFAFWKGKYRIGILYFTMKRFYLWDRLVEVIGLTCYLWCWWSSRYSYIRLQLRVPCYIILNIKWIWYIW